MATKRTPKPDTVDKERQVLELRRAGATFDDIARTVGYSNSSGAWQAYNRALERTLVSAGSEELRIAELDRLDRLQRATWTKAMQGDVMSINTVLRIMDRRAKYLGLDAPIRQEITVETTDVSLIDREIARLIEMMETQDDTAQKR